jgi:uracil-DNA glycosylase
MDEPKNLRFEHVRIERITGLCAPHMAPLSHFVETLRQRKGDDFEIPYFDPLDGGVNAQALFLLEAPGPRATGSGFVSRDNPDPTAANIWTMSRAAGLDRRACLLWNVCPWYVGTDTKIRPVKAAEVHESAEALQSLLGQLADLRCVALVGRKSQLARTTVEQARPDVRIVEMPHPSQMFVNRKPGNRALVLDGFRQVAGFISETT